MSLYCLYFHRLFSRADSSGSDKTREDVRKIPFPTKKHHGIPSEIEIGETFRFKTPSSIWVLGPFGCGKTCFTESSLLDHLEELSVTPPPSLPPMIHYCYGAWQAISQGDSSVRPSQVMVSELVLDDLMAEGGEDKALLDLFTKHSIIKISTCQDMFPPGKYANSILSS